MRPIPGSFRLKLIAAMMLLVAGATFAVLYLVQRHVQTRYDRMFRTQFDRQIQYFTIMRDSRLSTVKELSVKLTQKSRIIGALAQDPPSKEALYDLRDEDMRNLRANVADENKMAQPSEGKRSPTLMIRFLDGNGKVVQPPIGPIFGPANPRRTEQKLSTLRSAFDSRQRQEVGYLSVGLETNRPGLLRRLGEKPPPGATNEPAEHVLQEIIITKVVDPGTNRILGALVLAFQVPDLIPEFKAEHPSSEANSIHSGVLLDGRLYGSSSSLPEALASAAADQCAQHIAHTKTDRHEFSTRLDGKPYRVFYQALNPGSSLPTAYQVCFYSADESKREQKNLRTEILSVGGGALLIALLLSLVLSHGFSDPIRKLVSATREIRQGNYKVEVPVRGRDELGELASSFNEMAEGLSQKERYRTLLNQIADEKVAQQLISGRIKLGGELREVTVLFCDIRGFTALTQGMPPEQVIEMLNEHMTALTAVIRKHNGVLDKFVGDLLMAIFGAPVEHGNDVLSAAHCALDLIKARASLNITSHYQLSVGIGIATGTVVAGGMGSSERFHYTVLGERVNLASRLCAQAKPGEILIDQTTFEMVQEKARVEPAQAVQLKGFHEPVRIYRLVSVGIGDSAPNPSTAPADREI